MAVSWTTGTSPLIGFDKQNGSRQPSTASMKRNQSSIMAEDFITGQTAGLILWILQG